MSDIEPHTFCEYIKSLEERIAKLENRHKERFVFSSRVMGPDGRDTIAWQVNIRDVVFFPNTVHEDTRQDSNCTSIVAGPPKAPYLAILRTDQ